MPKHGHIRRGSLQIYPRKRARKLIPDANWNALKVSRKDVNLLGFIGYKVGMASAHVKDNTPNSMSKGKRIIIPVTIIECPPIKVLSIRFYKNGRIIKDIMNNLDKELKKKIKIQKENKKVEEIIKQVDDIKDYDDVRVVVYSQVKKTNIKKTPDICEIGLSGNKEDKLDFIKNIFTKEIVIRDVITDEFLKIGLVDVRGVTKGKGFQGPTKRFGLSLQHHKTEKGVRGPGSGGPWHPARVEFRQPMAGQMGFFTRVTYNNKIIFRSDIKDKNINPKQGFINFGHIKNGYLIVNGSIQGPSKRQVLITVPLRPTRKNIKRNYEFLELK